MCSRARGEEHTDADATLRDVSTFGPVYDVIDELGIVRRGEDLVAGDEVLRMRGSVSGKDGRRTAGGDMGALR